MPYKGLTGKVAIVTGAASGIGKGSCRRLVEEGCKVVGVDISGDLLKEVSGDLGSSFLPFEANVADEATGEACVQAAVKAFGGAHLLVNNAGVVGHFYPVSEMPIEEFDRVHSINMRGAFIVLKAALRQMIVQQQGGSVVNIASIGALRASRGSFPYGSSKRAMIGMSNAAALENGKHNIRVNTV